MIIGHAIDILRYKITIQASETTAFNLAAFIEFTSSRDEYRLLTVSLPLL